jgi:hypothetical protein
MTVSGKDLAHALALIAQADPRDVAATIADQDLLKARPGVREVDSNLQGDGRTRSPRAREIEVGPAFGASGGSTRAMSAQYDDLADQLRSAGSATELGELLELPARMDRVEKNLRGQLGLIATIAEAAGRPDIAKAVASLLKAKAGDGKAEEEEEEAEGGETKEERAKKAAAEKAAAALRGDAVAPGTVLDVLTALQGGGPIAKAVPAIQSALDDDGIDLTERLRLASAATRAMVGQA